MFQIKFGGPASATLRARFVTALVATCYGASVLAFSLGHGKIDQNLANAYRPSGDIKGISELLVARAASESSSLANAKRIILDLLSSSTCSQGTTARLLQQCKAIKPNHQNSESELQKENARTAYAISMALCEARQARILPPPSCRAFETMLGQAFSDDSIEIYRQEEIESCSNEMYETPSWTSLNVYKAQSKDLCDASRIDYQREELLAHFRKATNVIPDILDALKSQQLEAELFMASIREGAAGIVSSQRMASALADEQAQQSKQHLNHVSEFIAAHIEQLNTADTTFKAAIVNGLEQASEELAIVHNKANRVHTNLAEIYAAAAEAVSSLSSDVSSSYQHMAHQANHVAEQMIDLGTSGHLQAIQESISFGRDAASEYAKVQAAQVEQVHAQLSLSQRVLQNIEHSQGRLDDIQKAVDLLPVSWFEALHTIQQQVAHLRTEAKCALIFIVPCILLLLFGRCRAAAVAILLYVFARTIWSISKAAQRPKFAISVTEEGIKLTGLCMLGTISLGGSVALICTFFRMLSGRRKQQVCLGNAGPTGQRPSTSLAVQDMAKLEKFSTVPRKTSGTRFDRARSVPADMA